MSLSPDTAGWRLSGVKHVPLNLMTSGRGNSVLIYSALAQRAQSVTMATSKSSSPFLFYWLARKDRVGQRHKVRALWSGSVCNAVSPPADLLCHLLFFLPVPFPLSAGPSKWALWKIAKVTIQYLDRWGIYLDPHQAAGPQCPSRGGAGWRLESSGAQFLHLTCLQGRCFLRSG